MDIQYDVFVKQWFCMFQTIVPLGYMILISTKSGTSFSNADGNFLKLYLAKCISDSMGIFWNNTLQGVSKIVIFSIYI